jgi:hypothetical protein
VPQRRHFFDLHCRPRTTIPIASRCCLAPMLARGGVGKALLHCIGLKRYRFSTVSIFIVLFSSFFSLFRLQFFQMLRHRPLLFGFNEFFANEPASSKLSCRLASRTRGCQKHVVVQVFAFQLIKYLYFVSLWWNHRACRKRWCAIHNISCGLWRRAAVQRATGSTGANEWSSGSHAVMQVGFSIIVLVCSFVWPASSYFLLSAAYPDGAWRH